MIYEGKNDAFFQIENVDDTNCHLLKEKRKEVLALHWFQTDGNILLIDNVPFTFNKNDIIFTTEFHTIAVKNVTKVKILRFNKPFYCILDHDSEVGCKGILYYGASNLPIANAQGSDLEILETTWKMLALEMAAQDNLQEEMLQMMLKRILIQCTRMYKSSSYYKDADEEQSDLIRSFNFLVEKHFRTKHSVQAYADLMFKSPKTLSNSFKKTNNKTPLQFIHERILLEARRLLNYTDKSISEIGYEIGFADVQTFSRFFKKKEGVSPLEYKEKSN